MADPIHCVYAMEDGYFCTKHSNGFYDGSCRLLEGKPCEDQKPPKPTEHIQMNLFDEEILHPNCTVQELRNTETGEVSFGWWENENPPKGVAKTHYDQVKAMSLEEMAIHFSATTCPSKEARKKCVTYGQYEDDGCVQCWRDWLKQEVETNV